MTIYQLTGFEVLADHAGRILARDDSKLEIIVPNGVQHLGATYLNDDPQDMVVKLADYNLKIDGTHIFDGDPPDAVEMFVLSTQTGTTSILNLSYRTSHTQLDRFYAVDGDALPALDEPDDVQRFLGTASVSCFAGNLISLELAAMPDVDIRGYALGDDGAPVNTQDMFDFTSDPTLADSMIIADIASGLGSAPPEPNAAEPELEPSASELEEALVAMSEAFAPDYSEGISPS